MRPVEAYPLALGDSAVVNRQLIKIREYGERQFGRPCVAPELQCRVRVVLQTHGRFFGFEKKLWRASNTEAVVGNACSVSLVGSWTTSL